MSVEFCKSIIDIWLCGECNGCDLYKIKIAVDKMRYKAVDAVILCVKSLPYFKILRRIENFIHAKSFLKKYLEKYLKDSKIKNDIPEEIKAFTVK